jgi:hypothetical protein
MRNLAGVSDCDEYIRSELRRACIDIHTVQKGNTEVPYTLIGKLGEFEFKRAWYYWVVKGPVPLEVAKELYEHPEGRATVRSGGDCAKRPPETWVCEINGEKYVDVYHIDGQAGLLLFAQKIKKMYTEKWKEE